MSNPETTDENLFGFNSFQRYTGSAPILTSERFAELIGVTQDVVLSSIKRGYLPTVKIGKRRYVNVVRLTQELLEMQ
ncbi:DNA-binding protein [Marinomonas shanghaiensis]|uniref:DNA-binding protein n=1 Tax=Marinomonas shanghaiensis TaxID=2202418 RepID=UPI001E3730FE|nr:DNA-binding protein [Marinomonas shanghaiensis]